ncbi:MAG: FAD:protein FMN transferase [Christensenella sp.]|nr:FAD:protein FMN transferase [Christensenella sp.]
MKRIFCLITAAFLGLTPWIAGCAASNTPETSETYAMNTIITQTVYTDDSDILVQNNEILRRIEDEMSKTIADSDVARINAQSGEDVIVSDATAQVLADSIAAAKETGGAFNPALGTVISAWGFGTEDAQVPDAETLSALLKKTDYQNVSINGTRVNAGGTQIDLGGCVKGYALDRLAQNLNDAGVQSAILSVGGSLYAVGQKPDGAGYRIGIRDPEGTENDYMATMDLNGRFVSTSGTYERGFTEDGVYYYHLLDPQTGYPANSGITSVTVVCDNGFLSDAYSTALFVMGAEKGIAFAQAHGADVLYLTNDHHILTTEGFASKYALKITNDSYMAVS